MFNELTKLFGGQRKERRRSPRKRVRFNISWLRNGTELVPGIGSEISVDGCFFATKTPPNTPEFNVVMEIEGRKIRVRLRTARLSLTQLEGKTWTMLGCTFSGIAADDYDFLVRFCKDMDESANRVVKELAALNKNDDAYRMLPMRVQRQVLDQLVRLGRLEEPLPNQQPLLRMSELGTADGKRRLAVHSRISAQDAATKTFDSIIVVDRRGYVRIES